MKPYRPEMLLETIHKALEIKKMQAEQKVEKTTGTGC
jgi:hypothetical protein